LSGGHVHALYRHTTSRLHRLRPEVKLAATLLFVAAVVATPREAIWAFAGHALLLATAAAAGRLPPGFVVKRLLIEIPFLLFAVALPFLGRGERVDVLWFSLSREGLWGAWNVAAKATLGAGASIVLAGTTQVPDLLRAFARLHLPKVLVSIMGFMIRYLDVVIGELQRMRIALRSRGYAPRRIGEARALAATTGTLFVRSYERGERVYLAMLSRGYSGTIPDSEAGSAPALQWIGAVGIAVAAGTLAAAGWMIR
jgi:cobalt/nickel transport system permease protein